MTRFLLAAALSIGFLEVSVPQGFFDVPDGPLVCRPLTATVADSAHTMFEFAYGESDPWETLAAFDSAGLPLYMTVQRTVLQPTSSISHNVAVRFSLGGQYLRVERAVKDWDIVNGSAPIVSQDELTSEEIAKSRQLAEWFWAHRCSS
jgi:hypothetical protein